MHTPNERGIALVLALFLMSGLSVLGASLMFLSQTETASSMNYRMMSQARYAAEAGIQKASNFLLDPTQYACADCWLTCWARPAIRTVSPVTCDDQEVILSASTAPRRRTIRSPRCRLRTTPAAKGTLASGDLTLTFGSYARLLGLQSFDVYGGAAGRHGDVGDGRRRRPGRSTQGHGASPRVDRDTEGPRQLVRARSAPTMCGAITFGGNVTVNSYDSSRATGVKPTGTNGLLASTGGDVGTNGNLTISGSVDVEGNLYTPRTGVGACTSGRRRDRRVDEGGNARWRQHGEIAGPILYPTPNMPGAVAAGGTSRAAAGTCAGWASPRPTARPAGSTITLTATA